MLMLSPKVGFLEPGSKSQESRVEGSGMKKLNPFVILIGAKDLFCD